MLTDSLYIALGEIVKSKRKEKKWSQDDLAEKLHISRASIANIESGKFNVDFHIAVTLANELGFSLNQIENKSKELQVKKSLLETNKPSLSKLYERVKNED